MTCIISLTSSTSIHKSVTRLYPHITYSYTSIASKTDNASHTDTQELQNYTLKYIIVILVLLVRLIMQVILIHKSDKIILSYYI